MVYTTDGVKRICDCNYDKYLAVARTERVWGSRFLCEIFSKKFVLLKATTRKYHYRNFKIDFLQQRIVWDSRKKIHKGRVNFEGIQEVRFGQNALNNNADSGAPPELILQYRIVILYLENYVNKSLCVSATNFKDYLELFLLLRSIVRLNKPVNSMKDQLIYEMIREYRQRYDNKVRSKSFRSFSSMSSFEIAYLERVSLKNSMKLNNADKLLKRSKKLERVREVSVVKLESLVSRYNLVYSKVFGGADMYPELLRKSRIFFETNATQSTNSLIHSTSLGGLDLNTFANFILKIQNEDVDMESIHRIYSIYTENNRNMTGYELVCYLKSHFNSVLNYSNKESANLDFPLNDYYISSSHNTYLLGDQLLGVSSVEGYVRALLRGCRCVELDCWDGVLGEPVICHGKALTGKISFVEVIRTIKKYAFVSTSSPLILSLELRCSVITQQKIATILRTVLGSSLADKRMDFIEGMPSPNDLRYKILVKSKVINGGTESPIVFQPHKNPPLGPQQKSAVCGKIAKELSDLAVYLKGTTLTGITNSMIESGAIVSLSEYMAEDLCKSCTKHFIETNKSIFTRVYPAFSKITSVNYDPMQFWGVGVQMVALNFQTNDRFMMIHDAFFRQSLGTGYVLKPQTLRETTRISEKNATVSPKKECFSGSTTFIHHRTSFSSALKEQATNGSTFEEREVTDNSDKYVSIEFLSAEMGNFDFSSFFSDGLACGINVEYANTHPPQLVSDPFKLAALVRKYGNRNSSKDLLSGFSKHITTHSKRAIYLDFLRNGAKKLLTRPQRSREDETRENNENFYSTESYNTSVAGYTMYNRERLNHAIRKLSKSHPTKFGKISKKNPLKLLSFTSTDSVNPDITYRTKPSPIVTGYSYTFFQHEKVVLHHYDPTLTVVKFSLYLHQGHPRRPPSLSDAVKSRSRKPRFISFTENRHPICSGQNARSPPVATFSASQGVEIANFYLSLNDLKHGYRFLDLTPTQNLSNHLRPMNRTFASPSILVRISDFHSVKG